MKFRRLTIENYKSFQYPIEINFPANINNRNIFLIGGMNGAGKTSIAYFGEIAHQNGVIRTL